MKKSFLYLVMALTCSVLLSACFGSSSTTPTTTTPPLPVVQNLEQRVDTALAVSDAIADNAEPELIDDATASTPDDSEPKGV
jgi:hypothetical protein